MRQLGCALCLVVLALAACNQRQREFDTTTTTAATLEPLRHEADSEETAIKASALTMIEGTAEPEFARLAARAESEPEPTDRSMVTPLEGREDTWTPDVLPEPPEQRLP